MDDVCAASLRAVGRHYIIRWAGRLSPLMHGAAARSIAMNERVQSTRRIAVPLPPKGPAPPSHLRAAARGGGAARDCERSASHSADGARRR